MNNMVPFQNAQVPAFLQQTGLTPEQVSAMIAMLQKAQVAQ